MITLLGNMFFRPHSAMALITGRRVSPLGVKEYSTFKDVSVSTSLLTILSFSSSLSCFVNILDDTPSILFNN